MENQNEEPNNYEQDQNNEQNENEEEAQEQTTTHAPKSQKLNFSRDEKLKACLQILMKFPVLKYKKYVDAITTIIYEDDELLNDFLQKIDQPAEISKLDKLGEFLTCEYNREGDYHRSNLTNKYYPEDETTNNNNKEDNDNDNALRYPSEELREMELAFNKLFKEYTRLYYGGSGLCSVFCWELNINAICEGICVAVVIKNLVDNSKGVRGGCWDSSHLVVISFDNASNSNDKEVKANYKLTSTIFFTASLNHAIGDVDFSGSTTKLVSLLLIILLLYFTCYNYYIPYINLIHLLLYYYSNTQFSYLIFNYLFHNHF